MGVSILSLGAVGYFFEINLLPQWLIIIVFMLFGLGFGLSIHKFLNGVNELYVWVVGVGLGGFMATLGAKNTFHTEYITCEVCGYQAVDANNIYEGCTYCYSDTWAVALEYEVVGHDTWLRQEQFDWFGGYTPDDTFDFYHPLKEDDFIKDTTWHPLLTEQDLIDTFRAHIDSVVQSKVP